MCSRELPLVLVSSFGGFKYFRIEGVVSNPLLADRARCFPPARVTADAVAVAALGGCFFAEPMTNPLFAPMGCLLLSLLMLLLCSLFVVLLLLFVLFCCFRGGVRPVFALGVCRLFTIVVDYVFAVVVARRTVYVEILYFRNC
jgi:hypothetical protein